MASMWVATTRARYAEARKKRRIENAKRRRWPRPGGRGASVFSAERTTSGDSSDTDVHLLSGVRQPLTRHGGTIPHVAQEAVGDRNPVRAVWDGAPAPVAAVLL